MPEVTRPKYGFQCLSLLSSNKAFKRLLSMRRPESRGLWLLSGGEENCGEFMRLGLNSRRAKLLKHERLGIYFPLERKLYKVWFCEMLFIVFLLG